MQLKKSMLAALIGHAIERYDVVLYGFFAASIAPSFFPGEGGYSIIASYGSFAAGYLMRPIGGIFFGYLGDILGRKKSFLYSVLLVSIPTFGISILPTYDYIGIYAPIILILCRLMHGFCSGGEFSGAALYIGEHSELKSEGFNGSLVCAVGFLGVAVGTMIGSITTLPFMPDWGWRIPFFIGGVVTLASYVIRKKMDETPEFKKFKQSNSTLNNPLKAVFQSDIRNLMCTICIGATGHIFLYTTTIYLSTIYKNILHIQQSEILAINTFLMLYWMILVVAAGYI